MRTLILYLGLMLCSCTTEEQQKPAAKPVADTSATIAEPTSTPADSTKKATKKEADEDGMEGIETLLIPR